MEEDLYTGGYRITVSDGYQDTSHLIGEHFLSHTSIKSEEFYGMMIAEHDNLLKTAPHYRHDGPSNEELDRYPALRAAWNEFRIVKRMCGV
jgi:hypothetical protein